MDYGSSTLKLNSSDAALLKDPKVVGFRQRTPGRAIAVAFNDVDSAVSFVWFLERVIEDSRDELDKTSDVMAE